MSKDYTSGNTDYVAKQIAIEYVKNISYYYLLPAIAHHSLYHPKDIVLNTYLLNTLSPEYDYSHFVLLVKDSDEGIDFITCLQSTYFVEYLFLNHEPKAYLLFVELPKEMQGSIEQLLNSKYSKMPEATKTEVLKNTLDPQVKKLKQRILYPTFQDKHDLATFFNVSTDLITEIGPKVDIDKETFTPYW